MTQTEISCIELMFINAKSKTDYLLPHSWDPVGRSSNLNLKSCDIVIINNTEIFTERNELFCSSPYALFMNIGFCICPYVLGFTYYSPRWIIKAAFAL